MDASKLQFRTPASRFSLFSQISSPNPKHSRSNVWILVTSVAAMAVFLFLFIVSRGSSGSGSSSSSSSSRFGIVIDGGSTGTRIHVYACTIERGKMPVIDFGSTATMKVNPGLSSYSGDPKSAGESLVELLEFGREKVPKDQWGNTEVRLMATAGLRMLDNGVRDQILESCRRVLRSSGFRFRDDWATVISGSDEGTYAWVAANYALGTLGGDPQKTIGVIELGGASAQVTFVSSEPLPQEFSYVLKFGEATYNLYSHSFLRFGQNVAYESVRELLSSRDLTSSAESVQGGIFVDPCIPKGFAHGVESLKLTSGVLNPKMVSRPVGHATGNFSECRSATLMLLQKGKDKCLYQRCHLGSTFVPKLQGRFLATENFFYTSKFFGLGPTPYLSDLMLAGQRFCEDDWLKLKKKYRNLGEDDLLRYCFSSAYIVALLHDSLGIGLNDKRIGFANQVGNIQLDWALGAFIMLKASNLGSEHTDWITVIHDDSLALLSHFGISTVLVFTAWSMSKWRKSQLKTIYDLEKGRYIVTRVNR